MIKKIYLIICLIIMIIFLAAGSREILNSGKYGEESASKVMIANNGIDTLSYERIYAAAMKSYQLTGCIKSLIGGIGIIVFGFGLSKEIRTNPSKD